MNTRSSRLAFYFVVAVLISVSFIWFRQRPSFLLYQVHKEFDKGNQSAVILKYEKLLQRKNISTEEEIKLRKALGSFYLEASGEKLGIQLKGGDQNTSSVESPFLEKAKNEFNKVLILNPNDGESHFYLGRILLGKGLEKFAVEEFNLSRKLDPKDFRPSMIMGLIAFENGNLKEAYELTQNALALNPESDDVRIVLAQIYFQQGKPDLSFQEFDRLSRSTKLSPSTRSKKALYLAIQNKWPEALREISISVDEDSNDVDVKLNYGQILFLQEKYDDAAAQFKLAAELKQDSPWSYLWFIKTLSRKHEGVEAKKIARWLSDALPHWNWSSIGLAWAELANGNSSAALLATADALSQSSQFLEAAQVRAQILIQTRQFDQLGILVRPFLDSETNQSWAYQVLAESLILQEKYSVARISALSATQSNPQNAWAFLWLGFSSLKEKNADGESQIFRALNLNPYDSSLTSWGAYYFLQRGDWDQTEKILEKLESIPYKSALYFWIKGLLLLKKKESSEGIASLQKSIDVEPTFLQAHIDLIRVYEESGDKDLALATLRKAVLLNSKDPQIILLRKKLAMTRSLEGNN